MWVPPMILASSMALPFRSRGVHGGIGPAVMLRLGDEHMGVRQRRQLGQMGHAEHLLVLCQGL